MVILIGRLGGGNMFRMTSLRFRVCYYLSSLWISITFFMLYIIMSKFEENPNLLSNITTVSIGKIIFFTIFVMFIVSTCSLCLFKSFLKKSLKRFKSGSSPNKFRFSAKFNIGFRDFLLSVILPLTFTFSFNELPFTSLSMFILLNVVIYFFYKNSSDFFPNLPLTVLAGYSIVLANEVVTSENGKEALGKTILVFVKTSQVNEVVNTEKYIMFLEATKDKTKYIGIVN